MSRTRKPVFRRNRRFRSWVFATLAVVGTLIFLHALPAGVGEVAAQTKPRGKEQTEARTRARVSKNGLNDARNLLRQGKLEEGLNRLRALEAADPQNIQVIQLHGRALRSAGRVDSAIAVYEAALTRVKDPAPILVDLERILRETGRLKAAFAVCLDYQRRFGEKGRWVANEIESLIRSDRLGDEAVLMIEEEIDRRPEDESLRKLHFTALFFAGHPDRALIGAAELDRQKNARGSVLSRFAGLAHEKGSFAEAVLAFDLALEQDPKRGLHEEILYKKAQSLRKLHRLEEALVSYDTLNRTYAKGKFARRGSMEKAQILSMEMNRQEDALIAYEEVLRTLKPGKHAKEARLSDEIRLAMADCQLRLGRPGEAGNLYTELSERATDPAIREEAFFQIAEMYFYQGRAKDAEDAYYKLVDDFPTSAWVNDALQRVLLIGENSDAGGVPLTALAQAEYQRRLGEVRLALELIDEALGEYPKARAADDLLLRRVDYLLVLGEIGNARASVDTLTGRFPESPLAPRGMKAVADAYLIAAGGATEAQAIYMEILIRYPDSIEAPEVRATLQELERRTGSSLDLESEPEPKSKTGQGTGNGKGTG